MSMDGMNISRRALLGGAAASAALPAIARAALPAFARATPTPDPWSLARAIVARIKPPVFPDRRVSVRDHGAIADGKTLATDAFARAIAACAAAGGGHVVVPPGTYLTGPIRLRSNIDLHVEEGATILFSTDPAHYPLVHTRWEGTELMNYSPLVYAYRERNVAVTGGGTLDGQASGENWWSWKGPWEGTVDNGWREGLPHQADARDRLMAMGEAGTPIAERVFGEGGYLRPPLVQIYACENVLLEGFKARRAPFWQIHPVLCRNMIVRGLDLLGHGPNNDGCDPESCSDMLIEKTIFDAGDDCIAIKSGRNAEGRRFARPSENIVIRDCEMREGHAGIAIGSEISGGVRNIFGERCRMSSADLWYALRFKNNAMRGGVLEQFHFRDIDVGQVSRAALTCDFNYQEGANGPYKPILRDVTVERLRVAQAKRVLDAQGLPGAPVERLTIRNSSFEGVTDPSIVNHVEGLSLSDVRVNGKVVQTL